jgi:16S rRNA (guanine1207-N2)-methyltransferase
LTDAVVERSSQVIVRNEGRLPPGPLLLVNPPRDTLFRQLETAARTVRAFTQDFGDYRWLSDSGAEASFAAIPEPDPSLQTVLVNLPREKDRLVMLLQALSSWIPPTAQLWLVGENKAGGRSAGAYLKRFFSEVHKLDTARHCVLFEASGAVSGQPFDLDGSASVWPVEFCGRRIEVVSLPGVFAHGRLDEGSRLLLEYLEKARPAGKVLDFACGSGVIACSLLAANPEISATLLDVSALALESCKRTLAANGLTATLLASDGLSEAQGRYDWIVSNPPFHRGVSNDLEIAARFFARAGTFLADGGRIVIVCNRHLPYQGWLQEHFEQVDCVEATGEFKVIRAGTPRNH